MSQAATMTAPLRAGRGRLLEQFVTRFFSAAGDGAEGIVPGAPQGLNVSHAEIFNEALVDFLTGH